MNENKSYVNLTNVRSSEQLKVMEDIEKNNECPFCPDALTKYHKEEILRKGIHWTLTKNQWPYKNTDIHLLAISNYHAEKLSDLKKGSFDELLDHMIWAENEYQVNAGGLTMRFGDVTQTGATVRHLHAHFIVPSPNKPSDEKVRFKIG